MNGTDVQQDLMLVPAQYHFTVLEHASFEKLLDYRRHFSLGIWVDLVFYENTSPIFLRQRCLRERCKSLRHDLDVSTWCVDTCQMNPNDMFSLVFAFVQIKPISSQTYSVRAPFHQEALTLLEFWSLVSLPGFTYFCSPRGFCFRSPIVYLGFASCLNSLRLDMPSWQTDSGELAHIVRLFHVGIPIAWNSLCHMPSKTWCAKTGKMLLRMPSQPFEQNLGSLGVTVSKYASMPHVVISPIACCDMVFAFISVLVHCCWTEANKDAFEPPWVNTIDGFVCQSLPAIQAGFDDGTSS